MYIVKQGSRVDYNYKEIYIDTAEEKENVDTKNLCPGSVLYIISTGEVFILNNKKEWIAQ